LKDGFKDRYYVENPPVSTICKKDDILVVRTGSTGQIITGIEGCFHNNFFKVNYDKEKVYGRYLYYCLITEEKQKELALRAGVTVIPDLNHFMFLDMKIPLHSLGEQKNISNVLDSINKKIELNNKINKELESMAKTLYDYWFIQFDFPDENGKPYKSSGGKMVYNKELKREIPSSWDVKNLFDCMDVQYGYPFDTKLFVADKEKNPVIRIRDILDNTISIYTTEDVDSKYVLESNDLLIGMDGNFHMNFWDKDGSYLNQRVVRIRSNKDNNVSNFQAYFELYPYIKLREKSVSRTTVAHLSDKDLKRLYLLNPVITEKFNPKDKFNSLLNKIIANRLENQKLIQLRDWLLPMLMNGQVTIKDNGYITNTDDTLMAAESKARYGE
jgi:type I restriction enzyme S subunit